RSVFFNDTATTEIYTLSLHDALPISRLGTAEEIAAAAVYLSSNEAAYVTGRSEEHTSELQSLTNLRFRLLLEKTGDGAVGCRPLGTRLTQLGCVCRRMSS